MPSFLNDENSPIFSNNHDVLDLDPHNQFGLASDKDKVNGGSIRHVQSGPINDSFDESSTTSTRDSDIFDANPMAVNGTGSTTGTTNGNTNGTHLPSMSPLPAGKNTPAGNEARYPGPPSFDDKPLPNGNMTLPDRTVPRQSPTVANGAEAAHMSSTDMRHTATASGRQSPADGYQKHPRRSAEGPASHLTTIPSETEASTATLQASSFSPATLSPEPAQHKSVPHRFSSPPTYQSGDTTPNTSSSGHLQAPSPGNLKHRHTLEVPKLAPGRLSRDGMDTAQASGRYSPTVTSPGQRRASLSLARRNTRSMQSDMPRDEIVPDEDAIRWAEAYRQKRASKRKRKEEEDDDRVVVGTKVDEKHANWVTAYNMLTGIRVSVSRTNAKLDRDLTNADFEAKQKSTFDIAGNELVPSAKYDFKFKDYAPWVFRRLRTLFQLDPADYLMSLTGKYILSELGSPGKSGSFFYFSRDYKYIIKTIHHAEHKFLRKTLKEYHQHVSENPNTLLSQFYGLHRVKMPYGKKIHFVVMNNLFPPHRDIHSTFDLKGSTIGRNYKEEDLADNPRATMKDLNWLRRQRHLELGLQKKRLFLEQLQRDVALLKRLQIMDYSLLIGVHDLSRGNEENLRDKTLRVFNPGGEKASEEEPPQTTLLRTPSKMETARKARELRQMIRQERPVPMGEAIDKMPDVLGEGHSRPGFVFTQDDGGFRATHENNNPADEIYYLGVIDCLTHYGMIKKIEHFWKGLSSDRRQISALPPDQYGDRFYNFIEGITMSPEAAQLEAQQREREALEDQQAERSASRTSRRKSTHGIPPMPDHQPPAPPVGGLRSPEGRETVAMANREAQREETSGPAERQVPERTLRTTPIPLTTRDSTHGEPVLPIVEEAGENRPETPPKDKLLPPTRAPPPTPPKTAMHQKLDSADSGYEGYGNGGGNGNGKPLPRLSRESLRNKSLPPLPPKEDTEDSGVRMAA